MRYTLRDWRSGHRLRSTLLVIGVLLVGGVLGAGAVKVFHKVDGSSAAQTAAIAEASAGYGLSAPTSATVAGQDLFVANQAGSSVTVVNVSTGGHVSTLSGSSFDLDQPTSITNVGPDIFVANGAGDSVTEFDAATRAPVRIIAGPQFHFSNPIALAGDSNELFVLSATGAVTGVSPTTGGLFGHRYRAPVRIPFTVGHRRVGQRSVRDQQRGELGVGPRRPHPRVRQAVGRSAIPVSHTDRGGDPRWRPLGDERDE